MAVTLLVILIAILYFGIHINNDKPQTVICPPNTNTFTVQIDGIVSCGGGFP